MKSGIIVAACLAMALIPQTAMAAGEGEPAKCADGQTLNPDTNKCEKKSALSPDDLLIDEGRDLAYAGRYDAAIAVLWRVTGWQSSPRALNYLGYAHRKTGDLDQAFAYYRLALSVDPDYTLARAYLGEGYLAIDRPDLAERELAEIASRAGTDARAYRELAGHIAAYRNG